MDDFINKMEMRFFFKEIYWLKAVVSNNVQGNVMDQTLIIVFVSGYRMYCFLYNLLAFFCETECC